MIVGLVGEAVVIAENLRPLIPGLFLSPDNTCVMGSPPYRLRWKGLSRGGISSRWDTYQGRHIRPQ